MPNGPRPLIGITCRMDRKETTDWFYLQREYTEAVWAAGGLPLMIPLIADRDYARLLWDRLDAVVLSGSASDVDPSRYGAQPHPRLGPVHSEKDVVDISLVELSLETRKPLLAICFGTQAMNVAMGGSLVQHLETALDHSDKSVRHGVVVESDSWLARIGAGVSRFTVNSTHHQALDRVAPGLRITARAECDQVIEAVETTEPGRFLVGVQWHPERIWRQEPLSRALFQELVRQAGG